MKALATNSLRLAHFGLALSTAALMLGTAALAPAAAQTDDPTRISTGKFITPSGTATNVGSLPMNVALTPDGKYALVSDMGFRQYLSVFDTTTGTMVSQAPFPIGTSDRNGLYYGIASVSNGGGGYTVYASQGGNDSIAVLTLSADGKTLTKTDTIASKRKENDATFATGDSPAGIAYANGRLFVANNSPSVVVNIPAALTGSTNYLEAGSLSVIDPVSKTEINRYTFPTAVSPFPNYPFAVTATSDGSLVFLTSQRDGIVYVLSTANVTTSTPPTLVGAIQTGGHPSGLLLNKAQTLLYVANATSDTISVISTATRTVQRTIPLRASGSTGLPGVSPVGLALSPDESRLYVALGDYNAVGMVDAVHGRLLGYVPAGWYPTGVAVSPDGQSLLIANAKGVQTRYPNPGYGVGGFNDNSQYDLNLMEGTVNFLTIPSLTSLPALSQQVLNNNRIKPGLDAPTSNPLAGIGLASGKIKHVFYIIKENRTYDQVLGDVSGGDGQSSLTLFGQSVTPNLHALAQRFVLMDRFFDCSEASGDGWPWSTRSYANEYVIKNLPYNYSGRSSTTRYDFEGQNNGYPVGGFAPFDVDGKVNSILFPPTAFPQGAPAIPDIADGPNGAIWDAVKRAGLSYRNYGMGLTMGAANPFNPGQNLIPDNYPAHAGLRPEGHDLAGTSDYDFRRFDLNFADSDGPSNVGAPFPTATYGKHALPSRFAEFKTEFNEMLAQDATGGTVPTFMTLRFMSDHTSGASAGLPTPQAYVADNDYGIGQFVDLVSHSPIWGNTAIFIIEDDAQDGPDHIDAHRSTAYVISPWIKPNSVDHSFYNTDSVLKTMELLLGLPSLSQYDAVADYIADWDMTSTTPPNLTAYTAIQPDAAILSARNPSSSAIVPGSLAEKLLKQSAKMDFTRPDCADPAALNLILWQSIKGDKVPMPAPVHKVIVTRKPTAVAAGTAAPKKRDADGDDD